MQLTSFQRREGTCNRDRLVAADSKERKKWRGPFQSQFGARTNSQNAGREREGRNGLMRKNASNEDDKDDVNDDGGGGDVYMQAE